jgi:hypothetical protein
MNDDRLLDLRDGALDDLLDAATASRIFAASARDKLPVDFASMP